MVDQKCVFDVPAPDVQKANPGPKLLGYGERLTLDSAVEPFVSSARIMGAGNGKLCQARVVSERAHPPGIGLGRRTRTPKAKA